MRWGPSFLLERAVNIMRIYQYMLYVLLFVTSNASANQFCFALAQTVYEQIYCELEVRAQTKGLPSFDQFKKNNEHVQASLLKRPAERNNIKLPKPIKPLVNAPAEAMEAPVNTEAPINSAATVQAPFQAPIHVTATEPHSQSVRILNHVNVDTSGCNLVQHQIQCDGQIYQLLGNKNNRHLAADALSDAHKMALPAYQQGQGVNAYVSQAYEQYIEKMCAIGLCGVTMTYSKFSFLYQDIQAKGMDFVQRFELMYKFLKKDKATMGVSESVQAPSALRMNDCQLLNHMRFVCAYQGRNYIYTKIHHKK